MAQTLTFKKSSLPPRPETARRKAVTRPEKATSNKSVPTVAKITLAHKPGEKNNLRDMVQSV